MTKSRLPKCGNPDCDNTADPRWRIHPFGEKPKLACDSCGCSLDFPCIYCKELRDTNNHGKGWGK